MGDEQTDRDESEGTVWMETDGRLTGGMFDTGKGAMNPRNAGWYSQYLPEQRYQTYVMAHTGLMLAVEAGTVDEIPDEMFAILAWAVVDDEAFQAGEQLVAQDETGQLAQAHLRAYGKGTVVYPGYTQFDIPKYDMDDVESYNEGLLMQLTDDGSLPVNARTHLYNPGNQSMVGQFLTGLFGTAADVGVEVVRGWQDTFGEPTFEPENRMLAPPKSYELFAELAAQANAPGENEGAVQFAANFYDNAVPIALDAAALIAVGVGAVAYTGATMNLIAQMLMAAPAGTAAATASTKIITGTVKGLEALTTGTKLAFDARRPIVAASGVYAGANIAGSVHRATQANLEDLSAEQQAEWTESQIGPRPEPGDRFHDHQRWNNAARQQQVMWRRAMNQPYIQAPYKNPQIADLYDPLEQRNRASFMDRYHYNQQVQGAMIPYMSEAQGKRQMDERRSRIEANEEES